MGCSKDDAPTSIPIVYDGKIGIHNQSGVRIRLLEFRQVRGEIEFSHFLNRPLNSGFEYFFRNMLDSGESEIFPGGDEIYIHYIADVPNPENPSGPLFDHDIGHTVNGITVYYIKAGGGFSINP